MTRQHWIAAFTTGLTVLTITAATVADAPRAPPPAKEFKQGRWQVKVESRVEGRQEYWFAAAISLVFGAGLAPTVVGRYLRRPWPAMWIGAGLGAATGAAIVLVLGRPEGTPAFVGPVMVGLYALVGGVAGWRGTREKDSEPPASPAVPTETQ